MESILLSEVTPGVPPLIRSPLPDAFMWRGYPYCFFPSLTPVPHSQSSYAPEIGNIVWEQAVFWRTVIAFSLGFTKRE